MNKVTIELIAKTCHEANRAYCEAVGDTSQLPWELAEQWQRDSAIAGVKYRLANPNVTPQEIHEEWKRFKIAQGWTWGPVKDEELKQHPCLVDYDQLPEVQKPKDNIFAAVVCSLGPALVG